MKKSVAVSSTITAGQDAPPTGLVLYGFPYSLTVVLLYKVEFRACLNTRKQSHFWSLVENLFVFLWSSVTYLWDLYRARYPLALSPLGLGARGFGRFYTPSRFLSHSLFAHLRGFLSPSLSAQLIPLGLLKTGAQCASYKMYYSNRLLI